MAKIKPIALPLTEIVIGSDGKLTRSWQVALSDLQITINKLITLQL